MTKNVAFFICFCSQETIQEQLDIRYIYSPLHLIRVLLFINHSMKQ